jgi:hypothetical protein
MYDVGDVVPLGIAVTDANGTLANGGSVVLTIGQPDGTTVTPTPANPVPGQYTVDYTVVQEGRHTVRWVVTGANATAYADAFNAREITDQLISLHEAKKQLRLGDVTTHDDDLRMFIASAGRAIENHTGDTVVRRTVTERHRRATSVVVLRRSPVVSVTTVVSTGGSTTWQAADLDVDPDTGIVTAVTGLRLTGDLTVTYVPGMRVIPPNYLLAARIITEHLWQTMRPFAGVANLPPGALEDSLDARSGGLVGFAIPNRALELLGTPGPLVA